MYRGLATTIQRAIRDVVTDCVSLVAARGARFAGQQQVAFLREVARALMKAP